MAKREDTQTTVQLWEQMNSTHVGFNDFDIWVRAKQAEAVREMARLSLVFIVGGKLTEYGQWAKSYAGKLERGEA